MNTKRPNEDVIFVLNNLIQTCKDGEEGFLTAGDAVQDLNLRAVFHMYAQQRARFRAELTNEVLHHGGNPASSGHIAGALHRGWLNIRTAVAGTETRVIVGECDFGEDAAVKAYSDALKKVLPFYLLEIVRRQYAEVKSAHDAVRNIKREVRAPGYSSPLSYS